MPPRIIDVAMLLPIQQTMRPVPLRLGAIRGDSLEVRLRLVDARTGRPIPLTGWSAEAPIWPSANADVPSHTLAVDVDQSAASQPNTGVITLSAAALETSLWRPAGYWSLVMIGAGDVRKTVIAGPWTLSGRSLAERSYSCRVCVGLEPYDSAGEACSVLGYGTHDVLLPGPQATCVC